MVARVKFSGSKEKEYYFNIGTGINLTVGKKYIITNEDKWTYSNEVEVIGFLPESVFATRTILYATPSFVAEKTKRSCRKILPAALNPKSFIKKVIFNDNATIVFWKNDTKTVIKCQPGDKYDKSKAIALCCMKKMFGNTSMFNDILREFDENYDSIN